MEINLSLWRLSKRLSKASVQYAILGTLEKDCDRPYVKEPSVIYLKYIQWLFVIHTSIKLKKKIFLKEVEWKLDKICSFKKKQKQNPVSKKTLSAELLLL